MFRRFSRSADCPGSRLRRIVAGRTPPPTLSIDKPERVVGQRSALEVTAAPQARLATLTVLLEQNGRTLPLFSLDAPETASLSQLDPNHLRVSRPFGKQAAPELQAGPAASSSQPAGGRS